MSWTESRWAKSPLVLVGASVLFALVLFALLDFIAGRLLSGPQSLADDEMPYLESDAGWYELKTNFTGQDQWGPFIYPVTTDRLGFRSDPESSHSERADLIFLGDSYTYGINGAWDETFVGKVADKTDRPVLNAGVASYSPTAYLHQYQKALDAGALASPHDVVIAVDIGDVQDEAGVWADGPEHPVKVNGLSVARDNAGARDSTVGGRIAELFPMSAGIYRFARDFVLPNSDRTLGVVNLPRSAFTYRGWAELDASPALPDLAGYGPRGVQGGLDRVRDKMKAITDLARANGGTVHLLAYPWPDQLTHDDTFDWVAYLREICAEMSCGGVIDTVSEFRARANADPRWLQRYFLASDIHFNDEGNGVIADALHRELGKLGGER
jgi:hypothetical protein